MTCPTLISTDVDACEVLMADDAMTELREHVRSRYAEAARTVLAGEPAPVSTGCCGGETDACCGPAGAADPPAALDQPDSFGAALYPPVDTADLPPEAVRASLGCGSPLAVADLPEGETGCWT
jgi:hypothetical protein